MIEKYKKPVNRIRAELENYITKSGLKSIIVGVSGGIDSALCMALAKPVCDKLNVKLISRSITILTNKDDERSRAEEVGKAFSHDYTEVDLSEAFNNLHPHIMEDYETADHNDFAYKIRVGNLKARMRMLYLYDLAAKNRGMVLSTDNYTELLLGFWTLHGDVGDYGMIQNLWKTEVYKMSEFIVSELKDENAGKALQSCVDAVPTDGLGITNSDLEQIGAKSYFEVDTVLIKMLENPDDESLIDNKVVKRNRNSEYKRSNPFNIPRKKITDKKYF